MATPWLIIRSHLAKQWGLPPWEVDDPALEDEVGRWLEVEALRAKYD